MTAHLYEEIEVLTAERDFYRDQVGELTACVTPGLHLLGFTPQERRILGLLMRSPGSMRSREAVLIAADTDLEKDAIKTARVCISKLRKKLKALGIENAISKYSMLGYTMTAEASHELTKRAESIKYE